MAHARARARPPGNPKRRIRRGEADGAWTRATFDGATNDRVHGWPYTCRRRVVCHTVQCRGADTGTVASGGGGGGGDGRSVGENGAAATAAANQMTRGRSIMPTSTLVTDATTPPLLPLNQRPCMCVCARGAGGPATLPPVPPRRGFSTA